MKILLVSDTEEPYIWDYFDHERFDDIDLVISCGDLKSEYLSFLVTMINAPLFYVHGNHDKNYLKKPPEGCESIDGKLVTLNGIRLLGLGGSFCYSGEDFQYTEKQMEKRVRKLRYALWRNKGFDILVTHAPAFGIGDGTDLCHKGFKAFNGLIDKYSPKYFIHGHQHLNYRQQPRIQSYSSTTVINAYGYHILNY
jgi:Icc-related predicted phosphoesterase